MLELIEGLNRTKHQFELYVPYRLEDFASGLSSEAIEEITQDLPFKLPSEVCQLYQWHNGLSNWTFLFENYNFLSLRRAVYEYQGNLRQLEQDFPELVDLFKYRFPIFENWADGGVFITVHPNTKGESPIYGHDIPFDDFSLRYHSLTDLILHSAEWYESLTFDDVEKQWNIGDVDDKVERLLDIKYMARERIIELYGEECEGE